MKNNIAFEYNICHLKILNKLITDLPRMQLRLKRKGNHFRRKHVSSRQPANEQTHFRYQTNVLKRISENELRAGVSLLQKVLHMLQTKQAPTLHVQDNAVFKVTSLRVEKK